MTIRMKGRRVFSNSLSAYKKKFLERGVSKIRHFNLAKMKHPTATQINNLELVDHTWTLNDRYYKLADEYYGDSKLWWVIAWFNQKPTESDVEIGEVLQVPFPLERVMMYLGL